MNVDAGTKGDQIFKKSKMTSRIYLFYLCIIPIIGFSCKLLHFKPKPNKSSYKTTFDKSCKIIFIIEERDTNYYDCKLILKNLSKDTFFLDTTLNIIEYIDSEKASLELGKIHTTLGFPQKVSMLLPKSELVKKLKIRTYANEFKVSVNLFLSKQKVIEAYHKSITNANFKEKSNKIQSDIYAIHSLCLGFSLILEKPSFRLVLTHARTDIHD